MTDTKIEWATKSWNPIVGCSIKSAGCTNCYAMKMAWRLEKMGVKKYAGLTEQSKAGPVWNGRMAFDERALREPIRWTKRHRVFVNSMGDLFHEDVPDSWIRMVFGQMEITIHEYLILTKRPDRMQDFMHNHYKSLANVWLGVSVEDQETADERIPILLDTPAAIRFISAEPLLGPIDLRAVGQGGVQINSLNGGWAVPRNHPGYRQEPRIHWAIVGGESGPGARPMRPYWVKDIRDQCLAAGVPFFFKQWGEHCTPNQLPDGDAWYAWDSEYGSCGNGDEILRFGKKAAGRLLDGQEWNQFPGVKNDQS